MANTSASAIRPRTLRKNDRSSAYVTHIVAPAEFYVHLSGDEELLLGLKDTLQRVYGVDNRPISSSFMVGTLCVAYYDVDQSWYRAVIKQDSGEFIRVQYIDYGNEALVPKNMVCDIKPEFLTYPGLALKCATYGVQEPDVWSPGECGIFIRMMERVGDFPVRICVEAVIGLFHFVTMYGVVNYSGTDELTARSRFLNRVFLDELCAYRQQLVESRNISENVAIASNVQMPQQPPGIPNAFAVEQKPQVQARENAGERSGGGYFNNAPGYRTRSVSISASRPTTPTTGQAHFSGSSGGGEGRPSTPGVASKDGFGDRATSASAFENYQSRSRRYSESHTFNQDNKHMAGSASSSREPPAVVWQRGSDILNTPCAPYNESAQNAPPSTGTIEMTPHATYASAFPQQPVLGGDVDVYYSHIDHLPKFYLIKREESNRRDAMTAELHKEFANMTRFVEQPAIGTPCCAMFYNEAYRAQILSVDNQSKEARILYVDFGNEETKKFDELKRLRQGFTDRFPPLAFPAVLDGVSFGDAPQQWTKKFSDVTESCETLRAHIKCYDEQRRLYVIDLYDSSKVAPSDDITVLMGLKTAIDYATVYPPYPTLTGKKRIIVTNIGLLPEFYFLLQDEWQRVEAMTTSLSSEFDDWESIKTPAIDMPCCAKFNDQPYRAKIVSFDMAKSEARVLYVDYGNDEVKNFSDVKRLPRKFVDHFYPAAIPAVLFHCNREQANEEMTKKFREIVENSDALTALVKRQKDDRFVVDLDEEKVGNVLLSLIADE